MLNTDAHNPVVKHRMTKNDFIKYNRGINDGNDLPEEFLSSIYDEIVNNEIRMKDKLDAALGQVTASGPGIAGALVSVGRGLQREAYMLQSSGMADKAEVSRAAFLTDEVTHTHRQALFKDLNALQRKGSKTSDQFHSASHFVHVRPLFEVAWIPVLAGISGWAFAANRRHGGRRAVSGWVQARDPHRVLLRRRAGAECICDDSGQIHIPQ
jgi:brefeldin A-inhibited guanine nucleotide-exchange protein